YPGLGIRLPDHWAAGFLTVTLKLPASSTAFLVASSSNFATLNFASFLETSTWIESFSTPGRDASAFCTLLFQPTGQVMPSTVRHTSVEALASAVAEAEPPELAEEVAELAPGLLVGGSD